MKNLNLFSLLLLGVICQAQIVNIPDANFKNALVNTNCADTNGNGWGTDDADTNNDGEIQVSEAEALLGLFVDIQNISSLEGIQSFTNLEILDCGSNELTSLNLTQNTNLRRLRVVGNELTSLDLTQNTNLVWLYCSQNELTSLDVVQNTNLYALGCSQNELTSLDLAQNTNLRDLGCYGNRLTSLDLTQNTNLRYLSCGANPILSLDLSQNTNLTALSCWNTSLTMLNIKNGNNQNFIFMHALDNPSLTCIEVDDETATYPICDVHEATGWCKDPWAQYSENCSLGTENFNQLFLVLYPNPTQDVLNIKSQEPIKSIRIYSVSGSLIKETSMTSINVSGLANGLYFAQVRSEEGHSVTKKFIKS